jgi:hypothetical protein
MRARPGWAGTASPVYRWRIRRSTGLPDTAEVLTRTPRKYGFHGTIKPPFTLAAGTDANALSDAAAAFCASRAPVTIPRLEVRRLGGFIAIVPSEPSAALADLAAATVARSMPSARRRPRPNWPAAARPALPTGRRRSSCAGAIPT